MQLMHSTVTVVRHFFVASTHQFIPRVTKEASFNIGIALGAG
jgi:hypothetical protein